MVEKAIEKICYVTFCDEIFWSVSIFLSFSLSFFPSRLSSSIFVAVHCILALKDLNPYIYYLFEHMQRQIGRGEKKKREYFCLLTIYVSWRHWKCLATESSLFHPYWIVTQDGLYSVDLTQCTCVCASQLTLTLYLFREAKLYCVVDFKERVCMFFVCENVQLK